MTQKRKGMRLSPAQIIPASFLGAILLGALLLLIPACTAEGRQTTALTALFTATTSVCVTGLTVVDIHAHFTPLGQGIIMLLIQVGGLGVVSVVALLMVLLGRRITLSERQLLQDAYGLSERRGLVRFLRRVFFWTAGIELLGAALYALRFVPRYGLRGVWLALFTAVSAFCNAGIDLIGPESLTPYREDPLVLGVTMALIILGGLGYIVLFDLQGLLGRGKRARPSEHARLVLLLSGALILLGAAVFFVCERGNPRTLGALPLPSQLLGALFESVTLRTAGFSTFAQGEMRGLSTFFALALMFIGGSPIGTAGGVKTVTFFLVLLNALSYLREEEETVLFSRRVSEELLRRASAIVTFCLGAVFLLTALLMAFSGVSPGDALFEVVSALGTVGLTRGLTPGLNAPGQLLVILAMFLGRIGPISMAVFFAKSRPAERSVRHATGRFFVG